MNIETLKQLATKLGRTDVCRQFDERLALLQGVPTRLAIAGGINSGKTTLANALTQTERPVSTLPNPATHCIAQQGHGAGGVTESASPWMKECNLEVWELTDEGLPQEPQPIDLGLHYARTDLCVMLLTAQAALSRTDLIHLQFLGEVSVPTLVVVAKADQLSDDDYHDLGEYIGKHMPKFPSATLLLPPRPTRLSEQSEIIRHAIDSILHERQPKERSRQALRNLFIIDTLAQLIETCQDKLAEADQARAKVEEMTAAKRDKLSDTSTIWLTLQADLASRRAETLKKLRAALEERKAETIWQFTHDTEKYSDMKFYWDKELPYQLENAAHANTNATSNLLNAEVVDTIRWLNAEITRNFNRSLNALPPITCRVEKAPVPITDGLEIADTQKVCIVARVGTVATVIAAGSLLATAGIGGGSPRDRHARRPGSGVLHAPQGEREPGEGERGIAAGSGEGQPDTDCQHRRHAREGLQRDSHPPSDLPEPVDA